MRLERSDLELEVLYRRIAEGEVDLQPDFQRGEVWTSAKKRRLIDSILRGWYVPSIHLVYDEKTGRDAVLDGQQRLISIREFFDDQLPVDGGTDPYDPTISQLGGLLYSELPAEAKKAVRRFVVTVISLRDYTTEEPRELFFRLNQHMPLTPSEKRNSLYGPARDQIRLLVQELMEQELLAKQTVGFANGRLGYDDVLARFGLAVHQKNLTESLTSARIEELYRHGELGSVELESMRSAATDFLVSVKPVGVRFNKATLFSWLVFTYGLQRRNVACPSGHEVAFFESERHRINDPQNELFSTDYAERSRSLYSALAVYNDRSAYRVSDALSIRLRDLVLHLHYSVLAQAPTDTRLIPLMNHTHNQEALSESDLVSFLNSSHWGDRI